MAPKAGIFRTRAALLRNSVQALEFVSSLGVVKTDEKLLATREVRSLVRPYNLAVDGNGGNHAWLKRHPSTTLGGQ